MKHQTLAATGQVAVVTPVTLGSDTLSKEEKLKRWIALLELQPERTVQNLFETEFKNQAERDALRCEHSALALAFQDPILRSAGLASDRYGDAKNFFSLTDTQMHKIVCGCESGEEVPAALVAVAVRNRLNEHEFSTPTSWWSRLLRDIRNWRAIPDHAPNY